MEEILKQILGKLTTLETDVKDIKIDLKDVRADLRDVKTDLKDVKSRQDHRDEMFEALLNAQKTQKVQIDRLTIDLAHANETLEQMADDVNFLVRKASQNEKAIRELRRLK